MSSRHLAVPEVGGSSVVSILMVVVLPAPLGPSKAKVSPASILSERAIDGDEGPEGPRQVIPIPRSTSMYRLRSTGVVLRHRKNAFQGRQGQVEGTELLRLQGGQGRGNALLRPFDGLIEKLVPSVVRPG